MKFTIEGRLDGLNEYTRVNRANKYNGNSVKKKNEKIVIFAIRQAKLKKIDKYPISLEITWYEPNKRRDVDNITFAAKFILDSLVKSGILENDSQKYVNKISHDVQVDRDNPRIEILINEKE